MFIGVLEIECIIPGCKSLKDKRQVLRSFKDKTRNKFNVSLAETDFQDKWQRAAFGLVTVSGSHTHLVKTLDEIERFITTFPSMSVIIRDRDIF